MVQNDDTTRQEYVRRYLPDDRWMAAHILPVGVGTLCNIQTNEHHPANRGASTNYSLKYNFKREPQLSLPVQNSYEEPVSDYFKCQVVSLASAAAFNVGDPVTEMDRSAPSGRLE